MRGGRQGGNSVEIKSDWTYKRTDWWDSIDVIEILTKTLQEITVQDVEALVVSNVQESEQVEFKETLATRDGAPDGWIEGRNRIGDRAKNTLLREVTAFANGYGGAVVLGIKESDSTPPTAEALAAVPRCADLAERLKLIFRDRIEPQLPGLEVFAVPTEDEGGVVILRVRQSRLAPHRVTRTNVCPVRRADRCEDMTMREIQDMTLNVSRGLERLENRFSERRERFKGEFDRLNTPHDALGFRCTAMPLGDDIQLDRVFRQYSVVDGCGIPSHRVRRQERDQQLWLEALPGLARHSWRPLLRGARADSATGAGLCLFNFYGELHCNGLVELGFLACSESFAGTALSPDLPMVMFANLAVWASRIRAHASASTAEYAIEFESQVVGAPVSVGYTDPVSLAMGEHVGRPLCNVVFPRYPLKDRNELPEVLDLVRRDFWNSVGEDIETNGRSITIEGWTT